MGVRLTDLSRQIFGRLTVISYAGKDKRGAHHWQCRCECGNEKVVRGGHLRSGAINSCGCLRHDAARQAHTKHGYSGTSTYKSWKAMLQRCTNPSDPGYPNYGGRGITACDRWRNSFGNFLEDMGERPRGHSLDRIDNERGYEPGNCRWATRTEQSRNTRSSIRYEWDGRSLTLGEWEEITGISYSTLWERLNKLGWSIEKTLTTR